MNESTNNELRILIRFSSLGDLTLCSGIVDFYAKKSPNNPLIFVSLQRFENFIKSTFPHKKLEVLGLNESLFKLAYRAFRLGWNLQEKFPGVGRVVVHDLHGVLKSKIFRIFLALSLRIKRVSLKNVHTPKFSFMRWLSVFRRRDLLKKRHVYLDHQKQLPGFDKGDLRQAPRLLTNTPKNTSSQKKILIAPDSLHWKKRWPITYWEKLLYMILSHKDLHHCTIVGDNNVFPQDFIEALKDFAPERVENLLGKTRVEQLADVANSHDVTVCGNSAWLHISEAVGTPVVTLAGPIVEGFGFSPWMEKSRELSIDLSCRPCSKHGQGMCLLRGEDFHSCMRKIEPEKVFMNMEKVLY